jgi:hypothetical protein
MIEHMNKKNIYIFFSKCDFEVAIGFSPFV